jgi:hypothetical protein
VFLGLDSVFAGENEEKNLERWIVGIRLASAVLAES